jgi:hypothetical protein
MTQLSTTPASKAPSMSIKTKSEEMSLADVKTGPAAATFIAAGVGTGALGLIIPLSEAIPAFKTWLTWNAGVGPLSGKTIIPTVLFFIVWLALGLAFRDKNVNLRIAMTVGFVGLIIGLLGSFPPVYDLFTAK